MDAIATHAAAAIPQQPSRPIVAPRRSRPGRGLQPITQATPHHIQIMLDRDFKVSFRDDRLSRNSSKLRPETGAKSFSHDGRPCLLTSAWTDSEGYLWFGVTYTDGLRPRSESVRYPEIIAAGHLPEPIRRARAGY